MKKYIEVNALKKKLRNGKAGYNLTKKELATVFYDINNMPSADVRENKHGEWIKGKEISRAMLAGKVLHIDYENFKCSNCGLVLKELLYHTDGSPFYKFCPNCGADMRG